MSSYAPLTRHLAAQIADEVRLSFAEIETVIGRKLPRSAASSRAFWSNNASNNVMTRAWLAAGFKSEQVDLPGRTLVFRRAEREHTVTGFNETQAPFELWPENKGELPPLFGWMKGLITIAPGVDLTEPADPDLGDYLEKKYEADDPLA